MDLLTSLQQSVQGNGTFEYVIVTVVLLCALALGVTVLSRIAARWGFCMGAQVNASVTLYSQSCCNCGIEFAVPTDFDANRRKDHKTFYCPSGHGQSYHGKTEEEKRIEALEAQLARERSAKESEQQSRKWAEQAALTAKQQAGKARAKLRRTLERVECGVCPHCQRTFKQLAAHMKSKHADVLESDK